MSHHFLNLLEALQECNSTPLPKVSMCRIRDSDHTSSFFVKKRDTAVFVHFVCGWMWCWRFSVCLKKEYFSDLLSFPLNKIEFRLLSMVHDQKKKKKHEILIMFWASSFIYSYETVKNCLYFVQSALSDVVPDTYLLLLSKGKWESWFCNKANSKLKCSFVGSNKLWELIRLRVCYFNSNCD